MSLPPHRIPKIKAECPVCGKVNSTTVMSQPFSAGYHRRHICNECDNGFYTLANYENGGYTVQVRPFKDRALTIAEQLQRAEWAAEAQPVTFAGNNPFATEFIETINIAFEKFQKGEALHESEQKLIDAINHLEESLEKYVNGK